MAELGISREGSVATIDWPSDAEVVDSLMAAPPSLWDAYNLKVMELRALVEELEALVKGEGQ